MFLFYKFCWRAISWHIWWAGNKEELEYIMVDIIIETTMDIIPWITSTNTSIIPHIELKYHFDLMSIFICYLHLHESSQKFLKAGFSKLKKNQNSQTHTLRVMVMVMVGVHNISILRTCCVSVLPFFGKKITHSKVTKSLENHTLYTLGWRLSVILFTSQL